MNNSNTKVHLRLAAQTALLGAVTPDLRAVIVDMTENTLITKFFYDGPISEEDQDIASTAGTEILSSFSNMEIDEHIIRLDFPAPIPREGILVYGRYEP